MFVPRKRFGQHFLVDPSVIAAIVHEVAPQVGDRMVEIGPGLGALTQPLLERLGQLTVIELDRDLAARLRGWAGLTIVQGDVLRVDWRALAAAPTGPTDPAGAEAGGACARLRLIGNLPYNISSPILFHLLAFADLIADQHFMLQLEVVERMIARPSSSAYGRMSVMLQWRYQMERVLLIGPQAFEPQPRVQSAVVRMRPNQAPVQVDPDRLAEIVRIAFSQRRKLLRHTLGHWLDQHRFGGSFDLQRRAEEVTVEEYLALACASGQSPPRPAGPGS